MECTVCHDDNDRYANVGRADFDRLGHYRETTTGGNFSAGNVRTTFTHYNPDYGFELDPETDAPPKSWPSTSAWVLNTYTEQTVTEGGVTAKTQTCFEPETGFLLRSRTMVGTTPGSADVIMARSRDDDGNVVREEYFGDDVEPVSTSDDLCGLSLPEDQYRIDHTYQHGWLESSQYVDENGNTLAFKSVDHTIDQNTGLVSESRDSAGLTMSYEWDVMNRLIWVKPATGHGSWTQYVYTPATSSTALAKVEILHRPNGSETATALARTAVQFEAFGRVWKEQRLMPGIGWATRETRYHAMGWKSQISEYSAGTPVDWTRYLDYDPFGRPRTIRPPDGASYDVRISYTGVRLVERTTKVGSTRDAGGEIIETESTTTEEYDRQQRLYRVSEPSDSIVERVLEEYLDDVSPDSLEALAVRSALEAVRDNIILTGPDRP